MGFSDSSLRADRGFILLPSKANFMKNVSWSLGSIRSKIFFQLSFSATRTTCKNCQDSYSPDAYNCCERTCTKNSISSSWLNNILLVPCTFQQRCQDLCHHQKVWVNSSSEPPYHHTTSVFFSLEFLRDLRLSNTTVLYLGIFRRHLHLFRKKKTNCACKTAMITINILITFLFTWNIDQWDLNQDTKSLLVLLRIKKSLLLHKDILRWWRKSRFM